MSTTVKVAVLGTGALGKEHARLYAALADAGQAQFVGVFDVNSEAARRVAEKLRTRVFTSVAEAAAAADALSIVTPTSTHYALARELLPQRKQMLRRPPTPRRIPARRSS